MTPAALRIVLLDDRREDRLLATRELRRAFPEIEVQEVLDAADFDAALARWSFDAVVTDLQLRWSSGITIVQAVKARDSYMPVIMFTATGSQEAAVEAMKAGLDDYVIKSPQHIIRLSVAVNAAVDRARARREAETERRALLEREQDLRRQAETATRSRDEFLATVSHELRTPLTAVLGWARMLRSKRLDAPTAERAMDVIERNVLALRQLIEEILDVSRVISGRVRLDVQRVDLGHITRAAIEAVEPAATAKQIAIEFLCDEPVQTYGDAARLQQIVWNLVGNAVKFTPRGGRVHVRVEDRDPDAVVTVADTGPGILADMLPHVFVAFHQGDSGTTRTHGGLGLGLAIVRHLAELHGGGVEVMSPGDLGGATFTVRLPRWIDIPTGLGGGARSIGAPAPPLAERFPMLDGIHVLVVENEVDTRDVIAVAFRACGAEVTVVASAAAAREALARAGPDVIVSDISMADEDGYEFVRKLRALPPERGGRVPAIALTAHARFNDTERALAEGYDRHVAKPVDPAHLCQVAAELVSRS